MAHYAEQELSSFFIFKEINLLRLCIWLKKSLKVQLGIYNEKHTFLPPQPLNSLLPPSSVEYFMQHILLVIRQDLELTLTLFHNHLRKKKRF